jgi:hypothetical protein
VAVSLPPIMIPRRKSRPIPLLVRLSLIVALACTEPTPDPTPTQAPPQTTSSSGAIPKVLGYTYHRPDGNRLASVRGALPTAPTIDIPLDGVLVWPVGADSGTGAVWIAILDDGRAQGFVVDQFGWKPIAVIPDRLPVGMPPLLRLKGVEVRIVTAIETASSLTHPVPIGDQGRLAYIYKTGDLVLDGGGRGDQVSSQRSSRRSDIGRWIRSAAVPFRRHEALRPRGSGRHVGGRNCCASGSDRTALAVQDHRHSYNRCRRGYIADLGRSG